MPKIPARFLSKIGSIIFYIDLEVLIHRKIHITRYSFHHHEFLPFAFTDLLYFLWVIWISWILLVSPATIVCDIGKNFKTFLKYKVCYYLPFLERPTTSTPTYTDSFLTNCCKSHQATHVLLWCAKMKIKCIFSLNGEKILITHAFFFFDHIFFSF